MSKIIRVIGKRGRITIPYEVRMAMNIRCGDILSFSTRQNTITIVKEKLCDDCKGAEQINEFVKSLDDDDKEKLFYALMREKKRKGVRL